VGAAEVVHRIRCLERGVLVDMDEDALPFAGRIRDPLDAFLDELTGGGATGFEIIGKCGKGRVRHVVLPDYLSWLIVPGRDDFEVEQRGAQRLAVRIERKRTRHAAAERLVHHEVQRSDVR